MKRSVVAMIMFLVLGLSVSPVLGGAIVTSPTTVVTCTSVNFTTPGAVKWDRNTTGAGTETLVLEVVDGKGKTLFYATDTRAVGSQAPFSSMYLYTAAPEWNPIGGRLYSPAGNGLPEQTLLSVFGNCDGLPMAPPQSVPVPAGFEQREITCDVAVYDQPAGSVVGSNKVTVGQHWYVNLKPVAGPDGQNWTEIFVAGKYTGFIPTACVR